MDAPTSSGTALETVRLDRGLSQAALAREAGMSQAALSKAESGLTPLTGPRLAAVADALRCPVGLLTVDGSTSLAPTACVFHRKRASTTVGQAKQARARLALARVHAEALMDLIGAPPATLPRQRPTEDEYVTPEDIAHDVRNALGLGPGPIGQLVGSLESAGAVVVSVELGGPRVDALSDWVLGRRPVLLANKHAPGDRQRFTLAHEAGHAVMHDAPGEMIEIQADRFAAELLMPAADIRGEFGRVSLERLLELKSTWRVSAAALLRRAHTLGHVNDHTYRRLNTEMSAAGWKTQEPASFPPETPTMLARALALARRTHEDSEISKRTFLLPNQLHDTFEGQADRD